MIEITKVKKEKFNNEKYLEIEEFCTKDPAQFWEKLKNIGPRTKQGIPMETYDCDDNIVCDPDRVLNRWKCDYEKLYNRTFLNEDSNFDRFVMNFINMDEQRMLDPLYESNKMLNKPITLDELDKVKHQV